MNAHHHIFLILSFLTFSILQITSVSEPKIQRRILHQPLFPVTSPPPPDIESYPPPPAIPSFQGPDQPFFPQVPTGQTQDQSQQPLSGNGTPVSIPIATQAQQSTPIKKVAIAISVGIVSLGMLSALAFYLYKHTMKQPDESRKLVPNYSQRVNEESRIPPPSTFLYIGTVEPSDQRAVNETNSVANGSPFRKISTDKRFSERYRPSPDLQPLPPLSKPPPPPPIVNSPPPMSSSSDEESRDIRFYTPQGSSVNNGEGMYTPIKPERSFSNPVPHSKRTSPKPRSAASLPDVKLTIIPSIKQPQAAGLPPPLENSFVAEPNRPRVQQSRLALSYSPKRLKFSAPPPPPDMTRLQAIHDPTQQPSKAPLPPAPPPFPRVSTPRKLAETPQNIKPQSSSPIHEKTPDSPKQPRIEEVSKVTSSSQKHNDDENDGSKLKLKPLHWDKVRASSDRATVWDQFKESSFRLNEDMMESLFGFNSENSVTKDTTRKSILPPVEKENRVLDPKKSQNIAILLRALNVTRDEVSEALLEGNPEGLGPELLETLVKMAPTKEEEIKLRDYKGDTARLGSAERFLKTILDVPFAFKRVEAMLYRANFDTEVKYLRNSFDVLEEGCIELKNSRLFLKLLEAVLRTGNRMNVGTNRGDARSFKLDTLLKLVDIKGTDGKTTLLHFVVQEITRSEGESSDPTNEALSNKATFEKQGLQMVGGLSRELNNVKKAAGMDSDVLHSYVSKLEMGLEKVRSVIQYEKHSSFPGKFFESMGMFLEEAEEEIVKIKDVERKVLLSVRDITQYFHGDAAKEEAHPFRIFIIVRDFLSILDNVCKGVGSMQEKTTVGTARSFRIAATASLPVLNRYSMWQKRYSDDDSLSP